MGKRMRSIVVSAVLCAVLFGLMATPVQALGYAVYGYVLDTGGDPVIDVDVNVTWLEKEQSQTDITRANGLYVVTLVISNPDDIFGDILRIVADAGDGRTNTTDVEATGTGQMVNLTLEEAAEPVVTTIEVSPSTKELEVGEEQEFTAIAKDQSGSEMSGVVITWLSSNTTVGTVNPSESTTGSGATTTFAALAEGTTTVKAENGTVNDTASVTVYEPVVTTIEVSPSPKELYVGGTQQFIATAYDQYVEEMPDVTFTWSVSDETVGTVNETGFFEALAAGDTLVNATADNVNGTASVTVEVAPTPTPTPPRRGGGSYTPLDSDVDGYSDIDEMLAGTNPNDPNDYPGAAAPTPTPTATPTATPKPTWTPAPTPVATATPVPATPTPTPTPPGFEAVFAIAGLLAIAYLVLRKKK